MADLFMLAERLQMRRDKALRAKFDELYKQEPNLIAYIIIKLEEAADQCRTHIQLLEDAVKQQTNNMDHFGGWWRLRKLLNDYFNHIPGITSTMECLKSPNENTDDTYFLRISFV